MQRGILILTFSTAALLLRPAPARADAYARMAGQMARAAKSLKRGRIAVLQFPNIDGHVSDGPRAVQEQLTTRLAAGGGVQVVDRASLGQIVDEIALDNKGLLDLNASYKLGRILDVDAVVTGTLLEFPDGKIQIHARLIRIPDGLILAVSEATVKRTWNDPAGRSARPSILSWLEGLVDPEGIALRPDQDIHLLLQQAASAPDRDIALSAALARGRWLYERDCTYCHGPDGRGVRVMGDVFHVQPNVLDLRSKPLEQYTPQTLAAALKAGKRRMPETSRILSPEDASGLLQYVRKLTEKESSAAHAPIP